MIRIILIGAPGSGKGTMADHLKTDLGFLKISTGDMIREEVKQNSVLGQRMKSIIDQGQLVPDELIIELVKMRLDSKKDIGGYIMDGFPRTLTQAQVLGQIPVDRELVILLDVSEAELVRRLGLRLTCSQCGAIYNLGSTKPRREGICDQCGAALYRRSDDQEETIRQRIQVYHLQTLPVIEFYRSQGKLVVVPGIGSPEAVYRKVKKNVS